MSIRTCELVREETFGPAIPIIRVPRTSTTRSSVSNGTAYGLSSGVCTDRLDYITRFVDELQVGTVNIWEVPGYRIEMSPFGGIKDSGLGYKEGVLEAMKSFTNVKTWSLPWPGMNLRCGHRRVVRGHRRRHTQTRRRETP